MYYSGWYSQNMARMSENDKNPGNLAIILVT